MVPLALFGTLGLPELLIILAIVIFLFGARRIPELAKGLGQGIRGFRTSLKGEGEESDAEAGEEAPKGASSPD